ncbi:hypothetical protein ANO11243_041700 [Dothideomycetidae sp. 11243]|nr:hypothetical protein ANO11243_041700 [fungal sp. No.11243]
MGNCFGKSSSSKDNFTGQGRMLGNTPTPAAAPAAAPAPTTTAKVPAVANSPGRRLGAAETTTDGNDPKTAAARAAEVRTAHMSKPLGRPPPPKPMVTTAWL